MNRRERIDSAMNRRKEIEIEKKEYLEKINKLTQEYEMLGDYASRLLKEEEEDRKKKKNNYERII